jgi:hypothetical protein
METLKDILWPVVLLGGSGALIDFLIGRTGQEKARDWLLKWWVIFDDVRWRNFGREEGLFAGWFLERWIGKRILSIQRIKAFGILTIGSLLFYYLIEVYLSRFGFHVSCIYCNLPIYHGVMAIFLNFIVFTTSISFTKFVTYRMAYLCGNSRIRNFTLFIMMLIANFFLLKYWVHFADVIRVGVLLAETNPSLQAEPDIHRTLDDYQKLIQERWEEAKSTYEVIQYSTDNLSFNVVGYFASLLRFVLSIVFVGSFLLRPIVIRPISLVWARIVESDKPVFTVIFGGAAAFASAIGEAAKHL